MAYIWHSSAIKTAYRHSFLDILATRYPLRVFTHTQAVIYREDRGFTGTLKVLPSEMNESQEKDYLLFRDNEKCVREDSLICALFGANGNGYQIDNDVCALIVDNTAVCNKLTKTQRPTIWQILEKEYEAKNISADKIKLIMGSVRECRIRPLSQIEDKSLKLLLDVS